MPAITRTDLYDIALVAGVKMLIRQIEKSIDHKPLPTDLIVQVTNMASYYFLAGKNIRFILEMLFLDCTINKPRPDEKHDYEVQGADPEKSFICLMLGEVEECYSYHYNPEEDIYPDEPEKTATTVALGNATHTTASPTDEKKTESPANGTVAQRSGHRPRFRSIIQKRRFRF